MKDSICPLYTRARLRLFWIMCSAYSILYEKIQNNESIEIPLLERVRPDVSISLRYIFGSSCFDILSMARIIMHYTYSCTDKTFSAINCCLQIRFPISDQTEQKAKTKGFSSEWISIKECIGAKNWLAIKKFEPSRKEVSKLTVYFNKKMFLLSTCRKRCAHKIYFCLVPDVSSCSSHGSLSYGKVLIKRSGSKYNVRFQKSYRSRQIALLRLQSERFNQPKKLLQLLVFWLQ